MLFLASLMVNVAIVSRKKKFLKYIWLVPAVVILEIYLYSATLDIDFALSHYKIMLTWDLAFWIFFCKRSWHTRVLTPFCFQNIVCSVSFIVLTLCLQNGVELQSLGIKSIIVVYVITLFLKTANLIDLYFFHKYFK